MGFGADIQSKHERKFSEILASLQPEDLLKYGLIPEFVGRMPVVATLVELDEHALIDILTRPKNALIKQYQKLLALEGCKLRFTEGALTGHLQEGDHPEDRRPRPARHPRGRDAERDVRYPVPARASASASSAMKSSATAPNRFLSTKRSLRNSTSVIR